MPALVIKSLPPELHQKLRAAAAAHRRSLTQEVIVLLESALEGEAAPMGGRTPYFSRRQPLPEFAQLEKAGAFSGGRDSTEVISEERR